MKEVPTLIKWAGGKKQLLEQFKPFFGGGTVAFFLLKTHPEIKKIYLSDINEELVLTYNVVKNDIDELVNLLKKYKEKHNKEFYYKIRAEDVKKLTPVQIAARFIYLNRTCFNGLYRVNSKGQFNVPIGSYKNPDIIQEEKIKKISKLLKNVTMKVMSFEKILNLVKKKDFIYFDPPYYPLQKGKNFTTYTKDSFLEEEQKELSKLFKKLDQKGCFVME